MSRKVAYDDDAEQFEPMPRAHHTGSKVNAGKVKRAWNTAQFTKRKHKTAGRGHPWKKPHG